MRSRRMLTRPVAAAAALTGALLAALVPATAAHAESAVDVNLGGLASSLTAGGRGDGFTVRLQNNVEQQQVLVRRIFVVRLAGLTVDGLLIRRVGLPLNLSSPGPGEVHAFDTNVALNAKGKPGDEMAFPYQIQFTASAPPGKATVTFQAATNDRLRGTDSDTVTVKLAGGATAPPASPTVAPTTTLAPVPLATGTPLALVPLEGEANVGDAGSGSVPPILYLIGAALVALGGAILWLLLRGPRPAMTAVPYPTAAYPPQHRPARGMPLNPTAILPAAPPPPGPYPEPTDPWPPLPRRPVT